MHQVYGRNGREILTSPDISYIRRNVKGLKRNVVCVFEPYQKSGMGKVKSNVLYNVAKDIFRKGGLYLRDAGSYEY